MDNAFKFKVCETLLNLYCLYRGRWVCMMDPEKVPYPTQTVPKRYTDGTIMNHIDGRYCVCVFAGEHATKFISIDVDLGEPEVVHKVIDTMVELGIPRELIYVSSSGRKGYHVDIFFENYIYNACAEKFYWALIERSGLNPRKVEFRPTYRQAIKLPLGVHQVTHNRCWFVDRDTLEPIEDFSYVFGIQRIPQRYMEDLVDCIVNEHMREMYKQIAEDKKQDGMYKRTNTDLCEESLMVTAPGTRHNIQKKVAARARMDGCEFDDIVRIQMEWYANQDKRMIRSNESEVQADAEMLAAWAVKNIAIKHPAAKQQKQDAVFRIHKSVVPYILNAPTKSIRLVLFLLIVFCDWYGEAKISYKTISEYTGVSEESVAKAVKWLSDEGYIDKKNSSYKQDAFLTLRGSNIYKFPGEKKLRAPNRQNLLCNCAEVRGWITKDTCRELYIEALAKLCKPEYLAKYLTKPELEECRRVYEDEKE